MSSLAIDQAKIRAAIKQLSASPRGKKALSQLTELLGGEGLGLDQNNQQAYATIFRLAFVWPGTTMEALREAEEFPPQ